MIALPDEIAQQFSNVPGEIPRRILEAVAAEGFRSARLSRAQVGELLRLDSDAEDEFLGDRRESVPAEANRVDPRQERNFEAFRQQLPALLKSCYGQFVAMADGIVVDQDPDEMKLAKRVAPRYVGHPVLIQPVWGDGMQEFCLDPIEYDALFGRPK